MGINWGIIGWVTGALLTIFILRFVLIALKTMLSKENIQDIMYAAGDGVSNANKRLTKKLKQKAAIRKQQKREENRPYITVR